MTGFRIVLGAIIIFALNGCDIVDRFKNSAKRGKALEVYQEALNLLSLGDAAGAADHLHKLVQENDQTPPMVNNTYAEVMDREGRGAEALPFLEQFVVDARNTRVTDSLYLVHYLASGRGDSLAWERHYADLLSKADLTFRGKIRRNMIDAPIADFMLYDIQGNPVTLSSYRGKVVVIDFWATWCGPCIVSFPSMLRVMQQVDDQKVHFLYVNTMENGDAMTLAREFMAKTGYPFHTLIDQDSKLADSYRINGIPTKLIIGPDGKMKFKKVGYNPDDVYSERELKAMIALAAED